MLDGYLDAIKDLIAPFWRLNQSNIEKIFFFHYGPDYDSNEPCQTKIQHPGPYHFIRLRARVNDCDESAVESSLLTFVKQYQTNGHLIGWEKCNYDIGADLGNRFGIEFMDYVLDYLDSISKIMMVMALNNEFKTTEGINKIISILHLAGNLLTFEIYNGVLVVNNIPIRDLEGKFV